MNGVFISIINGWVVVVRLFLFLIITSVILSACGGGGGGSGDAPSEELRILSQPADVDVYVDEPIELQVSTAGGPGTISYQWYKDGEELLSKRNRVLRIAAAELSDSGKYHVVVRLFGKTLASRSATVAVEEKRVAPYITSQPVSIERALADRATLSVTAKGLGPLHYQWFKGEEAIEGATEASYSINSVDYDDTAVYRVEISNELGDTVSEDATLTVVRQRATGLWSGQLGDGQVDVIVPPSGQALFLRFDGGTDLHGVYRGQINSREGAWWIEREEGDALLFGQENPDHYELGVRNEIGSSLNPGSRMSATLRLFEEGNSAETLTQPLRVNYLTELSERVTPVDALEGDWTYLNDLSETVVNISLAADGQINEGSYVNQRCAVTGVLQPVEQSTWLLSATVAYSQRDGASACALDGLQQQGFVLVRTELGPRLAWYLYSEHDAKLAGYMYLPLQR